MHALLILFYAMTYNFNDCISLYCFKKYLTVPEWYHSDSLVLRYKKQKKKLEDPIARYKPQQLQLQQVSDSTVIVWHRQYARKIGIQQGYKLADPPPPPPSLVTTPITTPIYIPSVVKKKLCTQDKSKGKKSRPFLEPKSTDYNNKV